MKTLFLGCLLCLFTLFAITQETQTPQWEAPDFELMKMSLKDKSSAYYYPSLLQRYRAGDSTLSVTEFRQLYFGWAFQDKYNAYGSSKHSDEIKKLKEKSSLSDKQRQKLIELEEEVLEETPFSMRDLYLVLNLYSEAGDSVKVAASRTKLVGVAKAIQSTGDGLTDSTAYYVICVADEYDIIGLLGYRRGGAQKLIPAHGSKFDYITLADNDEHIRGLYFNIDLVFAGYGKLFGK